MKLIISKLGIEPRESNIEPVDSASTGRQNANGGELYGEISFPVDLNARYWVRGGLPNTVSHADPATDPQAALQVIIFGHASDIGSHLLFQNLEMLELGDTFELDTDRYRFTYTVIELSNPAKSSLADDSQVFGLPPAGQKRAVLVACLPNSASQSVRIGLLSSVAALP